MPAAARGPLQRDAGWGADPAHLHRQYALARDEFQRSLKEVLAFYFPDQPDAATREGAFLLGLLR